MLAVAADEIGVREQFVLLDEQKVAFDIVLNEVEKARGGNQKSVVIVSDGPGSGKSVIALSLLGELVRRGRTGPTRHWISPVQRNASQGHQPSRTKSAVTV